MYLSRDRTEQTALENEAADRPGNGSMIYITLDLGLHRIYDRISGFVCRTYGQKNCTWYILSSKSRSPLNITIKFRKL